MTTWYRTGTVSVENASTTVTGSLTAWLMAAKAGDAFVGPDAARYEITAVTSNTEIEIYPAYAGSTASGQSYAIERISTAWNSVSELSVTIAETAEAFQRGFAMRSTTSIEIGAGEHEFAVPPGLPILPGATLKIASAASGEEETHWISGVVTEYEGQTLKVLAQSWEGEGDTRSNWNINIAGSVGPQGPAGPGDVVGPSSSTNNNIAVFDGTSGKLIKDSGVPSVFTQAGDGAVARSWQDKAREIASVQDYAGCDPTGASDSSAAFAAAAGAGRGVYVPNGTYLVEDLKVPIGTFFRGENRESTTIIVAGDPGLSFEGGANRAHSGFENLTLKFRGTSGTCVYFGMTFASPAQHNASVVNCNVVPETIGTDEADKWLHFHDPRSAYVSNCFIRGSFIPQNDPSGQKQGVAIYADGTGYMVAVRDCFFANVYRGVEITDNVEGYYTSGSEFVGVYEGWVTSNTVTKPGGWIDGLHVNAVGRGIKLLNRNYTRINGVALYNAAAQFYNIDHYAAIELDTCVGVNLDNLDFTYGSSGHSNDVSGIIATDTSSININNVFMLEMGIGAGACFNFTNVDNASIDNLKLVACDNPMAADTNSSNIKVTNWNRVGGTWVNWTGVPDRNDIRIDAVQEFRTFFSGTQSAPSISGKGSSGTGIFWPAADRMAFSQGGVEAMRLGTNQNLWIGTPNGTSARRVHVVQNDGINTAVTRLQRLTHTTSGTPGVGIGAGFDVEVETSASNNEVVGALDWVVTDTGAGAEAADLVVRLLNSGAPDNEVARFKSSGGLQLSLGSTTGLGTGVVLGQSAVQIAHTGTTSETELARIPVPAGAMGANGRIEIRMQMSGNNDADNKTTRVRWGGTSGIAGTTIHAFSSTTGIQTNTMAYIANRGSASSQVAGPGTTGTIFGQTGSAAVSASADTSDQQDIVITGQLADGADTLNIESYFVILYPKG